METSYALLIWPRWSRRLILYGICAMHVAIGLVMGMYLFAFIMLVLNIAAFGVNDASDEKADEKSEAPATAPQIARQNAPDCGV
jgi:zona occludens toxin (predicted ATPase)